MQNGDLNKIINGYLIPYDLKCEYAQDPLGIDTCLPRLSWKLRQDGRGNSQTAYHIIASSNHEELEKGNGDLWDSGKVLSNQSLGIQYAGLKLKSSQECYWKVKVWDSADSCGTFSQPAYFEMGLLEQSDWKADWISGECPYGYQTFYEGPALCLRKEFEIKKKAKRARVYVSGLGYYILNMNGKRVGDHVLDPGFTDYDFRVLYATYAVDDFINPGWNAIGVTVGNGWYCTPRWNGKPCLRLQLELWYEDGTFETIKSDLDSGWMVSDSPIRNNGIYDGETYDANFEMPEWDMPGYFAAEGGRLKEAWSKASPYTSPKGRMVSQIAEPIRKTQELKPISMHVPEQIFFLDPNPLLGEKEKPFNRFVFDFGQNMAGWVRLKVKGEKNTEITLRYAETIYFDGNLNRENLFLAGATDFYILKGGDEEIYEPHFTYHGFRYVSVEGYPGEPTLDTVTAVVIQSDVKQIGDFQCSHPMINQLHQNILWTERSNMPSIPTDCPQRNERFGWVNDTTSRLEETIYNFDVSRFLAKWMNDIEDTQIASGAIADCAPYVWWGKKTGGEPVDSSFIINQWLLYKHYGDSRNLTEHYESLKKWVDFLDSKATDHILYYGWIGDWVPPKAFSRIDSLCGAVSSTTTYEYISTCYYYLSAVLMSRIANVVANKTDETRYRQLAEKVKAAFNQKFFDSQTKQYEMGSQAANSFALYLGLVPDEFISDVLGNLVDDIVEVNNGHLTTGNLCTKYLLEALADYGRNDIAWLIATQTTYPSWGYMIEKGATTIWERWEYESGRGMNSHNQPVLGCIGAWFYRALAGINVDLDGVGFDKIIIHPLPVDGLDFVNSSLETVRGKIVSQWEKKNGTYRLKVAIPVNCTAKIRLQYTGKDENAVRITESDRVIWTNGGFQRAIPGVYDANRTDSYYEFITGSGSYDFCLTSSGEI